MDADEVFSSEIQAADLVIFKSVTFIPEDYYYTPFPDGTPKILTFFTYGRMIFENCNIEVIGENGDTPSNGRGGDGGTATLSIIAIQGAEFIDSNITLIGGAGGNADYQDTNIELRGGHGGEALLRFGQSETVRGNVFFNENSSINITTLDGGNAYASGSGDYEYEEDGGDGGNIYLLGGLSNFTSDSEVYLHAGKGGLAAAQANGQYNQARGQGGSAGFVNVNYFQNFTAGNIDIKTLSGGNSACDVGVDETTTAQGGDSGIILINVTGDFKLKSTTSDSFFSQGNPGDQCADAATGSYTASASGIDGAPTSFLFNSFILQDHTINISLGGGGDSDADGDTASDGGDSSTLYFNGTSFEIINSSLNIKTFPAGNEHGDQGADGGKSDILFNTDLVINLDSEINIVQDATENQCAIGGDIAFRGDVNISSATIYLNASQGGGAVIGGDASCIAGHGGHIIINSTEVNLIDTSLHLQSGYGDSGVNSNANSGSVELTVPGILNLDNSIFWLQTNIKEASSTGANVGNLSALINNFTMDNSELRYTEGEPADSANTKLNITGYSKLNLSIINFTSITTATTAGIFFGYELNLIDSNLTNNSNSAANWTFQSIGWPYQFNHSYFSIDGSSCNPDLNIRLSSDNHTVSYYLPDYAACSVDYLGNLNTSNESTAAQYYTRIQNVTPVPNGSLAWADGGFNCFTQFSVYDSSAIDNTTTNNFGSAFSVGDSAWCNLRLNSSTFNHTSNVSTTIVKSLPYDWTLYIGGQEATWVIPAFTGTDVDLNANSSAIDTVNTHDVYVIMKNLSISDWATRNNIDGTNIELDVKQLEAYFHENSVPSGTCTCLATYVYTTSQEQNTSAQTSTSETWAWFNFTNPNSTLEVDYIEFWCMESYDSPPPERCENTYANVTGNWSYKPAWYDTELNGSITSQFRAGPNYWNQYQCTLDTCYIPINFTSDSSDAKMNLSLVFAEWGVDSPREGDYQVPIVITSDSSGDLNLSKYYFEYYNDTEIEMSITTNTNIERIINITHSKINFSQAYDYIEFYPASLSSKNVTPYGQNETFPFYNITYAATNFDFELAVSLNQTMPDCMNISISKDNTSQYRVLNTSEYELTNMTVNDSIGLWLKLDMSSCNRSALHALYTVDAYFDTCCDGCIPCFD